jgi:hypothetical protein
VFEDDFRSFLPAYAKPFSKQLQDLPLNYEKWVYATALPSKTYQGDLFTDVRFASVDDDGQALVADLPAMVISNTCDVQPGQSESILVAPLVDLKDYSAHATLTGAEWDSHLSALKRNEISQLMFLPKALGINDCFVDFSRTSSVPLHYFDSSTAKKRFQSLSQCGHYVMMVKVAHHFTRPEPPDAPRS